MNPILALIIANVIWGAASPIFKYALQNIPPFTLAFIRFFFAGLIFILFALKSWQPMSKRQFWELLLVGFFGISVNISFFFLGLGKTTSINAPVIASSAPIFIFLFSVIFLREKPNPKILSGMLISLIGVLLIIFSPIIFDGKTFEIGQLEGNLMLIVATLGSVFQIIFGKKVLKEINSRQVSAITFLFGSLTFFPFMANELRHWSLSSLNHQGWLGIIFGVFFSSALAYYLFYYGISKIMAQEVGLFAYIDPLVAIFIAIPLLGEYPNGYFIIASLLVFGGILIAENRLQWHPFHKIKNQISNVKNFNTIDI